MNRSHSHLADAATRSLRIAIVHAADLGGGAERSVASLHQGLKQRGHSSTLFVGEKRTDATDVIEIPYVRGLPGSRRLARAAERTFGWQDVYNPSFRALRDAIAGRYDLVHFNSLWGSAGFADVSALPAITRSVPGVITMRENWLITGHCACFDDCPRWLSGCGECPDLERVPRLPRDGTAFNWRRKRDALQGANLHVVAISDWLAARAKESPMLAGKTVSRIYNGIELETFVPLEPARRREGRAALGVGDDEILVLCAGQTVLGLNGFRAPRDAAAAFNALPKELRIRPMLVGDAAPALAQRIERESIRLPYQRTPAEMARCYGLADLTLVTSEAEAFGRIAAESQACGTPVVAFDTGAIPEVVVDGVGGRVVARGDCAALAAALEGLAKDAGKRARMAEAGRAYVQERFDASDIARQYEALYLGLLQ
jgi:glycosyltransferase involved in cell wall biosynthesis